MAFNDQGMEYILVVSIWGILAAIFAPLCESLGIHILVGAVGVPVIVLLVIHLYVRYIDHKESKK